MSAISVSKIYSRTFVGLVLLQALGAIAQTGHVYGGQQPVSGADIQLMTTGSTGYGSAGANLLGSTIVTTASDGSFSITGDYTCPTSSTLVYLTASGGSAMGTSSNSAIMLVTPLGACGNLSSSSSFVVNEVTTAATAFALGQYFTTTYGSSSIDSFGAPSGTQPQTGLANAFATVNNLVNVATGDAQTSVTLTGSGSLGSITAIPESAKLNTIANILDACVASSGAGSTPCLTLLTGVATSSGILPTDALQAAVYMSLNPTSNNSNGSAANLTALYALQGSAPPFTGLPSQPTDWTLGIQYVGSPTTNLVQPIKLAVDASGNLWVAGNGSGTYTGALSEISPTGVPLVFRTAFGSQTLGENIKDIAVDLSGNVWFSAVAGSGGGYYQYNPSTSSGGYYLNGKTPYGVAVDASNNVYFSQESTTAAYTVIAFPNGTALSSSGSTTGIPAYEFPIAGSTPGTAGTSNTFVNPEAIAFDTKGNLWLSSSSGQPSSTQIIELSNLNMTACAGASTYPCRLTTSTTLNTFTGTSSGVGSMSEPWGLATGAGGSVWVANGQSGTNSISNITSVTAGSSYTGGLNAPRYVALDGAGNVWVSNNGSSSVSEFSSGGTLLSPASSTGFAHSGISSGYGLAIDPSGNVWVANQGSSTSPSLEEIVGAAVPVVTPIAQGLSYFATGVAGSYPAEPQAPSAAQINSNPEPALASGTSTLPLGINVVNSQLYTTVTQSTTGSTVTYSFATPVVPPTGPYPIVSTVGSTTNRTVLASDWVANASGFDSLSYEKGQMQIRLLTNSDTALINLFKLLHAPNTGGILRIGGGSLETAVWTPAGAGQTSGQIAPADVDALAGFLEATGWKVLYGIPLEAYGSTGANAATAEANAAAEAVYVAQKLGSSLYAFEIGNEPDGYGSGWSYANYQTAYKNVASAIEAALSNNSLPVVPLAGGAFAGDWMFPSFAQARVPDVYQKGVLTQHYYRGAPSPTPPNTVADLISYPDTNLQNTASLLEYNGYTNDTHWSMAETNSYYSGGTHGVSNSYASALWSIDHVFTMAQFGGVGSNFHCGNTVSYSPIYNSGNTVLGPQPILSGMVLAAQTGNGYMQRTIINGNTSGANISAYAVQSGSTLNVVVDNKSGQALSITLTPGRAVNTGSLQILTNATIPNTTAPLTTAQITTVLSDTSASDVSIQGSTIGTDGSFTVNSPYTLPVVGNAVTFTIPPLSAALVKLQ
ncbi:NHL repeat-containing protein [Edaphobacter flagellatus]|uniref:hypothetical protein n=1 Tax=Edaphobacter flagellatus TaxID=1933044 RepID=UPI0021B4D021|nr:hypothetical protein [Edaphobacter flagellatus]